MQVVRFYQGLSIISILRAFVKKILGYGTDVDKLIPKCCLNVRILILFYICVLYQDTTRHPLCTRVTGGDCDRMQRCLS